MNQPESPPVTGLVAGKYQLVRMIGRGGMGSVWEARHASLGTPVAIKFIEPEYADSNEAKSRFEREAKAAAAIQSKHAIQIHDHGIQDNRPFIVMELLQGTPLDKRIEELGKIGRTLTLQETARIIQQVCRGLQRAHERGIVHRDLKPENIFLVHDEDGEIAKVLDFGIAKLSNGPHNPSITSSTKTGAVLGTPFYMSPEQARGLRNVDHRTDLWSLGVIAFKCVTGKLPFDGESVGDLLVKICTAPIPRPTDHHSGLPADFDAWFARTLERDPERRYASATDLATALAAAAGMSVTPSYNAGIPFSSGATVPAQHGASFTPPQPGAQPGYASTPNPGALTGAPFTKSQRIAGVGSSKGRVIGAIAAIAALTGAAGGGLWFYKFRMPAGTGAGVVAATPPTPPSTPVAPPPEPPTEPPTQISTAVTPPAPALPGSTVLAGTKPSRPALTPTKPKTTSTPPPEKPEKPAVATPPPPPPVNTAPAKKPPRTSDPGY